MDLRSGRPRIGAVFGAGGAKGFIHVGVLKVLEREGIPLDIVVGVSVGGFFGAACAAGIPAAEIERIALSMEPVDFLEFNLQTKLALCSTDRMIDVLRSVIGDPQFSGLPRTFAVVATDIETGEQVVLREGSVLEAVRATVALPGFYPPIQINGCYLFDGAVVNAVPVDIARQLGAGFVIAVDVGAQLRRDLINASVAPSSFERTLFSLLPHRWRFWVATLLRRQLILGLVSRGNEITSARLVAEQLEKSKPDVLIRPKREGPDIDFRFLTTGDFIRAREIIKIGEESAEEVLCDIKQALM